MYNCECCNYETNIKPNYTRHIKTKKHLTKSNISPIIVHHLSISSPSIYGCDFCNKSFASQSSLSKHHKKCIVGQITDLQKNLEIKNKEIEEKDKTLENNSKELKLIIK